MYSLKRRNPWHDICLFVFKLQKLYSGSDFKLPAIESISHILFFQTMYTDKTIFSSSLQQKAREEFAVNGQSISQGIP